MAEAPFRVEIVAPGHPHRGARGMCDPNKLVRPNGEDMALVTFDDTESRGADGCYAAAREVKPIAGSKDQ